MKKTDEMCSLHGNYPGVDVIQVKLENLHEFKNHPFKVEKDQALFELRQSIESEGILVPLLVRKSCDGAGYEIVSGHRRKEAALWVGLERVPVIVKELSDDQAIIAMVDSNLHREKILPSEKAFAYKMRLEAMKHQGKEITLDQIGPKPEENGLQIYPLKVEQGQFGEMIIAPTEKKILSRSNEMLARMVGESATQIKRYIRLTYLIPKLLEMVDREELPMGSAVDISFLKEDEQYELFAVMDLEQWVPTVSQANRIKRMSMQEKLDMDQIYKVFEETQNSHREMIKIPVERIQKFFPNSYTPEKQIQTIENLLSEWSKKRNRSKDMSL